MYTDEKEIIIHEAGLIQKIADSLIHVGTDGLIAVAHSVLNESYEYIEDGFYQLVDSPDL